MAKTPKLDHDPFAKKKKKKKKAKLKQKVHACVA